MFIPIFAYVKSLADGTPYETGDRRSIISMSSNLTFGGGSTADLINGSVTQVAWFTGGQAAGKYVDFDFGETISVNGVVWKSGAGGGSMTGKYQYWSGSAWDDCPSGSVTLNYSATNTTTFSSAVETSKIRFLTTGSSANFYQLEVDFDNN